MTHRCLGIAAGLLVLALASIPVGGQENGKTASVVPEGIYAIFCKNGCKCLDAHAPDKDKDARKVQGWRYTGAANQHWEIRPAPGFTGQYKIRCADSSKVLVAADPINLQVSDRH